MEELTLQTVIQDIRSNWNQVTNPTADRFQWDEALSKAFEGYPVWNSTDFNYGKCHSYEIVLHRRELRPAGSAKAQQAQIKQLGGTMSVLVLLLSVVANYYLLSFVQQRRGQLPRETQPKTKTHKELVSRAHQFATLHGFRDLPQEYLEHVLPDVELDLAERGSVKIFNCLFEDLDSSTPLFGEQ